MLRKFVVVAAGAAMFLGGVIGGASTARAEQLWIAASAYGHTVGYGSGWSEESAREEARDECARLSGRTCSRSLSVSVPADNWWLAVVSCPNGAAPGGSAQNQASAVYMAASKRGYSSCRVISMD